MKDSILMSHPYHRNTRSKHDHDTFLSKILEIAFESLIRALIPTYSFGSPIRVGQNAAAPDCHPERRAKDDNEGSIRLSLTHELMVQYVRINAAHNLSVVTFNQTWLASEPFM